MDWDDPQFDSYPEIDVNDLRLRTAAERVHANESLHRHDPSGPTCVYCTLNAARALAAAATPGASTSRRHLHDDDFPCTLAAVRAFLAWERALGSAYEPTSNGAWVDFDWLATSSHLSTTERAAIRAIEALAVFERHGGPPPTISIALRDLTDRVAN